MNDEERPHEYASPPCFMHELTPEFRSVDLKQWQDVAQFRKAERERLIKARLGLRSDERSVKSLRIASNLMEVIGGLRNQLIGLYWPIRGEPDLRDWMSDIVQSGANIALPVVIRKDWPLEYRRWMPGAPLERGSWNILVPPSGPSVQPSIIIAPLVGFDSARYRLCYGGGFFDRTLAAMTHKPRIIGVGFNGAQIASIYPQPHDIPMDLIVTDA
jgi:5-formyltetrahydrofolate cyclo-ligase